MKTNNLGLFGAILAALSVAHCSSPDGRGGLDKLHPANGPEQGFGGGGNRGNNDGNGNYNPYGSNTGNGNSNGSQGGGATTYVPRAPGAQPGAGGKKASFHIKSGTGQGAWNTKDEMEASGLGALAIGDTLEITNDDSVAHTLHTDGVPCGHGSAMAPGGGTFSCALGSLYDPDQSGPLHDHDAGAGGAFWIRVKAAAPAAAAAQTGPSADQQAKFTAAIAPILQQKCDGGRCHGVSSANPKIVGSVDATTKLAASILDRISTQNQDLQMPPATSGRSLTSDEAASLKDFLRPFAP